ncbi:hypothetical protein BJX68DRAFT_265029 [Aspergillus pseudodeflectus]|uniref:Hydantoinase B/oxoprolinase domain-containing protein n=1 Tax=Aspergillus pseudodeflectus TaxID=176178 RepID=A0ABR4KMR2_9EURO
MQTVAYLNDGSELSLRAKINKGTGQQPLALQEPHAKYTVTSTHQEPSSSVRSSVLRSLIDSNILLNQGRLALIEAILPEGTILSPSTGAATVGGSIETS